MATMRTTPVLITLLLVLGMVVDAHGQGTTLSCNNIIPGVNITLNVLGLVVVTITITLDNGVVQAIDTTLCRVIPVGARVTVGSVPAIGSNPTIPYPSDVSLTDIQQLPECPSARRVGDVTQANTVLSYVCTLGDTTADHDSFTGREEYVSLKGVADVAVM